MDATLAMFAPDTIIPNRTELAASVGEAALLATIFPPVFTSVATFPVPGLSKSKYVSLEAVTVPLAEFTVSRLPPI